MQPFIVGHAGHPEWRQALAQAAAQIDGQRAHAGGESVEPSLGFVYFSDHYAPHAQALLDALRQRWPGAAWVGTVGVRIHHKYFGRKLPILLQISRDGLQKGLQVPTLQKKIVLFGFGHLMVEELQDHHGVVAWELLHCQQPMVQQYLTQIS